MLGQYEVFRGALRCQVLVTIANGGEFHCTWYLFHVLWYLFHVPWYVSVSYESHHTLNDM